MNRPSQEIFRLFDASLNRACEGVRVLEDTARMIYDHAEATSCLKMLRHELVQITASIPGLDIRAIQARGTQRDVLRSGETSTEAMRSGITDIIQANSGRAQEAVRSLEEYAKLIKPGLSERYKSVRFSLYDCEQELMAIASRHKMVSRNRISHGLVVPCTSVLLPLLADFCRDYNIGSVIIDPYDTPDRDSTVHIIDVIESTRNSSVNILVRGRTDIAVITSSNGVMLKNNDLSPRSCRQILGVNSIIAASYSEDTYDDDSDVIDVLLVNDAEVLLRLKKLCAHATTPKVFVCSPGSPDYIIAHPDCDGIWIEVGKISSGDLITLCKGLKW